MNKLTSKEIKYFGLPIQEDIPVGEKE